MLQLIFIGLLLIVFPYEEECGARVTDKKKLLFSVAALTRRTSIEFDYWYVYMRRWHAGRWYETIMINCNPETFQPTLILRIDYILSH